MFTKKKKVHEIEYKRKSLMLSVVVKVAGFYLGCRSDYEGITVWLVSVKIEPIAVVVRERVK